MRRMGAETEVLVIGGGATGAGVARDAAMRGFATVLVEQAGLASGTTGHFHGQLHSGARYAVVDPASARECVAESATLRRIAPFCIEETGGLFVALPGDDETYGNRFNSACLACGIDVAELGLGELLAEEPHLTRSIERAFALPDAAIDSGALVQACAASATAHGAEILTGRRVRGLVRTADGVCGAVVAAEDFDLEIRASVVVNAAGPWGPAVAALAGCRLPVRLGNGVMVAQDHRPVNRVVSRLRPPGDGDILVPMGAELIIGTTDTPATGPGDLTPDPADVEAMVSAGRALVPGFGTGRTRAWAAVRPLVGGDEGGAGVDGLPGGHRALSRSHLVIDHAARDGVRGFLTITGGKVTTSRLMAEHTVDAVCAALGFSRPCTTAAEPLALEAGGIRYAQRGGPDNAVRDP
jgi:glycerol-3-phosphate dehydrogenase